MEQHVVGRSPDRPTFGGKVNREIKGPPNFSIRVSRGEGDSFLVSWSHLLMQPITVLLVQAEPGRSIVRFNQVPLAWVFKATSLYLSLLSQTS